MSEPSFVLIANPAAGRGHAGAVVDEALALLRAAGRTARSERTTSIVHAAELAAAAAAAGDIAVAVGGDGLVRAVAKGAAQHGGVVGIVPAGRGNDFARAVGITKVLGESVAVLLSAEPRPTDCIRVVGAGGVAGAAGGGPGTGRLAGDLAIGNVYIGFDSLSNIAANQLRFNLGALSYSYAALRVALTMAPLRIRLVIDGQPRDYDGSGVVIASSAFYGGAVRVAPGADPHDGLLDVILFAQTRRRTRLRTLLALRSGRHLDTSGVTHIRASSIQVTTDPVLEAYSDGDPIAHTPLTATVLPGAIGLLRG